MSFVARLSRSRRVVAFLACAVVILAFAPTPTPARAIEGGDDKALELPWVAKLETRESPTEVANCTGSFIDESWILTAAHCVSGAMQPLDLQVKVMRNGSLTPVGSAGSVILSKTDDVALVRLKQPASKTLVSSYVKMARWVQTGRASAYGYGRTAFNSTSVSEVLKSAELQIESIGTIWTLGIASLFFKVGDPYPWASKLHTSGVNGQTMHGDSGGPLLQFGALVGVLSSGEDSTTANIHRGADFVPLASIFDWVVQSTGLPAAALDATTVSATRSTAIWAVNGQSVVTSGGALRLRFGVPAAPLDILVDGTSSFQLRSGSDCVTSDTFVDGASLVVVSKTLLRMKPCDSTNYNQKFGFVLNTDDRSRPPQGVIRTVVGDQSISLLPSGELGLSSGNSTPVQFLLAATGSTTMGDLWETVKASSSVWSQPHRIGKRDTSNLVPQLSRPEGESAALPPLPNGISVVQAGVTSTANSNTVFILGDDGHVYRSTAAVRANFAAWDQLPGDGIVHLSASTVRGGAAYSDGRSTRFAPPRGDVVVLQGLPGAQVVDIAVGGTSQSDVVLLLGSDSHVYRYSSLTGPPATLAGDGVRTLVASRTADGSFAYASSTAVYFAQAGSNGFSFPLPTGRILGSLQLGSDGPIARVMATMADGSVWVSSNRAALGSGNAGWRAAIGADKGLVSFSSSGSPVGDNLWTDGSRFATFADRTAPVPTLPGGVRILRVQTTKDSSATFLDYALGTDGRLYRSVRGGGWSPTVGVNVEDVTFSGTGGLAFYQAEKK